MAKFTYGVILNAEITTTCGPNGNWLGAKFELGNVNWGVWGEVVGPNFSDDLRKLMDDAKVTKFADLKNKPIIAEFEGNTLKQWGIFKACIG